MRSDGFNAAFCHALVYLAALAGFSCFAEQPALRTISVLPATDSAQQPVTPLLQNALRQLYENSGSFTATPAGLTVEGYDEGGVQKVHAATGTELFSFAYLEKAQITIYLFDKLRPTDFILSTAPVEPATDGSNPPSQNVEAALRTAFWKLMSDYTDQVYQALPGTVLYDQPDYGKTDPPPVNPTPYSRDLSSTEPGTFTLAVQGGYGHLGGSDISAGPNVGISGEINVIDRARLALGIDLFTYALAHAEARYGVSLTSEGIYLEIGAGVGHILGRVATDPGSVPTLSPATLLWGPVLGLGYPLGKVTLRAEARGYWGRGADSRLYLAGAGASYEF